MQDGGVIPATGFPRDGGMAKVRHRKDDSITVQTYGTSHTTKHSFTGVVSAVIPSKRAFWGGSSSKRCRGSRRSRDIVEVVVRGDGRGTRDLGDGSGTSRRCPGSSGRHVAVHVRRGTRVVVVLGIF